MIEHRYSDHKTNSNEHLNSAGSLTITLLFISTTLSFMTLVDILMTSGVLKGMSVKGCICIFQSLIM